MRVLHVLDASLPIVAGYTSRAAAILDAQGRLGFDAIALTGARQPSPVDRELVSGVLHHRTRMPAEGEPGARLARTPGVREAMEMIALGRRVLDVHRRSPLDVIHAHSPVLCGLPAHAAARRLGVPSVYEIRAFWEDAAADQGRGAEGSARYGAIRAIETALCRRADAVIALCDGIRGDLIERGIPDDRIFVVPNGVDPARFTPRARDESFADRFGFRGKTVIAYIGKLFRFEGVERLLEALSRLTARDDRIRGLVIGYGEAESDLKKCHERLGLGGRVVLAGKVAPDEIAACYALADILCYPRERGRLTELTTPLKPLEAMSMGKAVVVSDVGGLLELVRDVDTGLVFPAGDTGALVHTLARLAEDAGLRARLGDRARAEVVRARSWTAIASRYRAAYEVAMDRSSRRLGARLLATR
jgi:glycogen synthase